MLEAAEGSTENYDHEKDGNIEVDNMGFKDATAEMYCKAGQSKRVWSELYKVCNKGAGFYI
jgi:hypothetical protein